MTDTNEYIIEDFIQNKYGLSYISFVRNIILVASLYLFYINVPFNVFNTMIKLFVILIITRFLISRTTSFTRKKDNKRYYQVSAQVSLLTLIVLLALRENVLTQNYSITIIILYGIFNIITKSHFTIDVVNSIILAVGLHNLNTTLFRL